MTKPSDASMKRAHEELERWYASGKGYYHPEALAALLDAMRDEALEEAALDIETPPMEWTHGEFDRVMAIFRSVAKRIRAKTRTP